MDVARACKSCDAPLAKKPGRGRWPHYFELAKHLKAAAVYEDVHVEWGGDWRDFTDHPTIRLLIWSTPAP